jgi:uncharacterized protein YpbB
MKNIWSLFSKRKKGKLKNYRDKLRHRLWVQVISNLDEGVYGNVFIESENTVIDDVWIPVQFELRSTNIQRELHSQLSQNFKL